jgi:hypothetical protein
MSRLLAVIAVLLALSVGSAMAQVQRRENGWSERGLFIFSPGYSFDFWHQRAGIVGAHTGSVLNDCSNAEYYCLSEGWSAVAAPRLCRPIQIGDAWTVGRVTTRVVARVSVPRDPHHNPSEHVGVGWILVTDNFPNAAFLYDPPGGIKALYQGRRDIDARAIAEAGRIDDEGDGLNRMNLISPDSLGPCRND